MSDQTDDLADDEMGTDGSTDTASGSTGTSDDSTDTTSGSTETTSGSTGTSEESTETTSGSTETSGETVDAVPLQAELEILREENRRLRDEYARARRSEYRQAALVLLATGLLTVAGGVIVSSSRTVLFALGGTSVFIGILTFYLTPERMLPAAVGRDVYAAMAHTGRALVDELGLQDEHVYVPTDRGEYGTRLFVPQHTDFEVPDAGDVSDLFVLGEDERQRGIAVYPTGAALFERYLETRSDADTADAESVAEQLSAAMVEQFELLEATELEAGDSQLTVGVSGSAYGSIERFDHPVPSLLGCGLARTLDRPVSVSVTDPDGGRADALVTCRWDDTAERGE